EPGFFGVYTDLQSGRSGDDVTNYMVEMNGQTVALPLVVRARLRGADEQTQVFEFEAPAGSTGGRGGTGTVPVLPGSVPSGAMTTLQVHTDSGTATTGPVSATLVGGVATVGLNAATTLNDGVITKDKQNIGGEKHCLNRFVLSQAPGGSVPFLEQ